MFKAFANNEKKLFNSEQQLNQKRLEEVLAKVRDLLATEQISVLMFADVVYNLTADSIRMSTKVIADQSKIIDEQKRELNELNIKLVKTYDSGKPEEDTKQQDKE